MNFINPSTGARAITAQLPDNVTLSGIRCRTVIMKVDSGGYSNGSNSYDHDGDNTSAKPTPYVSRESHFRAVRSKAARTALEALPRERGDAERSGGVSVGEYASLSEAVLLGLSKLTNDLPTF